MLVQLGSRRWFMYLTLWGIISLAWIGPRWASGAEASPLHPALRFYSRFDESLDADYARGDKQLYTATTIQRSSVKPGLHSDGVEWNREAGYRGGSLNFHKKTEAVLFYRGGENVRHDKSEFGGTVSLWMKLTPDDDLPDGYVDPLQITDKEWNNRSFFLDFTDKDPREFRLGVFSDYKFWNPQDVPWEKIAVADRPMVVSAQPPFRHDRWTHVAFTWQHFNSERDRGTAKLYLDGKSIGKLEGAQRFSWDAEQVVIMLGIYYVGGMDELAIFDRPLNDDEVKQLHEGKLFSP